MILNEKKKVILFLSILIIVGIISLKSLYHPGFYTSHDGWHQVARLYHFTKALTDGQFPPRFSGDLFHNFGYPLFIFSYHLPWWIGSLFVFAGFSIFAAIKWVFVLTFILSGITMFLFVRKLLGSLSGFLTAFIYLFTPYRFANILVRANIGEAVSLAFIPLVFWGMLSIHKGVKKNGIILMALGLFGMITSHIMSVFLFSFTLLSFFIFLFIQTKNRMSFVVSILIGSLLGFGLSAYYFLPAFYYKSVTRFQDLFHWVYSNYFTPLNKLIYSPWGYGAIGTNGEMSRQVGVVLLLAMLLSILCLIYLFLRKNRDLKRRDAFLVFIFVFNFCLAFFLMLKSSQFLWKPFEKYAFVDFPWRFLSVTTFTGSFLAGLLVFLVPKKLKVITVIVLIVLALYSNRNHLRVNEYTDIPLFLYIDSEISTNSDDEYLPKWVIQKYAAKDKHALIIKEARYRNYYKDSYKTYFDLVYDESYTPENPNDLMSIRIIQMFFPGVSVLADGKKVIPELKEEGDMEVKVPYRTKKVSVIYESTHVMRIGEIITLISFISLLGIIINSRTEKI